WEEARALLDKRPDRPGDEKLLPKDRPMALRCNLLNILGYYRMAEFKPKTAVPLHEESLALARKLYDPDSREIILRENNRAATRFDAGESEAPRKALEALLPRAIKVYGEQHPLIAAIRGNLARTLERQGEKDAAWREQLLAARGSVEHLRRLALAGSRRDHILLSYLPRTEFDVLMGVPGRPDGLRPGQRGELFPPAPALNGR